MILLDLAHQTSSLSHVIRGHVISVFICRKRLMVEIDTIAEIETEDKDCHLAVEKVRLLYDNHIVTARVFSL